MKSLATLLLLAASSLPVSAAAQTRDDQAGDELRRLEDDLSQALVDRDAAALDRLWHDDLIFIGMNGRQFTKAERLAGQQLAAPRAAGETNTNDDVAVRIVGDTAVVTVVSTWTMPSAGSASSGRYRALHVWTRADGAWRLLAAQVASIAE